MPFNQYGSGEKSLQSIYRERQGDIATIQQLELGKLQGRYRNTGANARAIPTSSGDVLDGDTQGDVLFDSSYLYICLNQGGVLTWCRISLASSW